MWGGASSGGSGPSLTVMAVRVRPRRAGMGPLTRHQPPTRTHPHWGSFPTQTSESQALKLVFASLHLGVFVCLFKTLIIKMTSHRPCCYSFISCSSLCWESNVYLLVESAFCELLMFYGSIKQCSKDFLKDFLEFLF